MACEISRPSPQVLFDRQRDMFSTTVLQGGAVVPESNEWYVVSLNYAVAEEFYAFSEQQWKERDPRFACCDNLISIAREDGVVPYAATFAQGYVQINGAPDAPLGVEMIEMTIGGNQYVTQGDLPAAIAPEGYIIVRVRSTTAGQQGNGAASPTGTINTPIPNVDSTVTVFGGFCGGEDAEECEAFRSRYLARLQFSPRQTSQWIEEKLLEWPCVTRVCMRGGTCGGFIGSASTCNSELQFHIFMDSSFDCGIPPQCVIDEVNEWMFGPEGMQGYGMGQVEAGVCGKIYPAHAAIINLTISDYGCISNSQKQEIRDRMAEFFSTLCPSTELSENQFGAIVGSVLGFQNNYVVDIEPAEDADVTLIGQGCGYELNCDAVACLGDITFIDTAPELGAC